MSDPITISAIEEAILARLRSRWAACGASDRIEEFAIGIDFDDILGTPAVAVTTERIAVERVVDGVFSLSPVINIYVAFKDPGKPDKRRSGIYPIVLGTLGILAGQKCGLDIDALEPGEISEVFHDSLKRKGCVAFRLQFSTSFDIEMDGDGEELVALMAIGVQYMRQDPSQETPDAEDEIEIPQEAP
jgi:hypothetical protein